MKSSATQYVNEPTTLRESFPRLLFNEPGGDFFVVVFNTILSNRNVAGGSREELLERLQGYVCLGIRV